MPQQQFVLYNVSKAWPMTRQNVLHALAAVATQKLNSQEIQSADFLPGVFEVSTQLEYFLASVK